MEVSSIFLYISTFEDFELAPGIEKKIRGQVKVMQDLFGHYALIYTRGKDIYFEGKLKEGTEYQRIPIGKVKNVVSKITYYKKVLDFLMENMTINSNTYHRVVYTRFSLADPYLLRIIDFLKSSHWKVVLEIPTSNFITEWKKAGIKGLYKWLTFRLMGTTLLKKVDLIVSIGSKPVIPFFSELCSEKTIVISNGIDVESVPFSVERNDKNEGVLNLIGVANVAPWHGYDRVITGLYEYYKTNPDRKVYFHIVGAGTEFENLKKLTETLGLSEFVIFHGPKHGEELDSLFDEAHVAIGSLGNHRKGLRVSADLKTREYCARGIPFVISYDDVDFPDDFPYMLKVPADENPVDIEQILRFYDRIKEREFAKEMREYAEKNLSWEAKLKPVIDEINKLLDEKVNKS